MFQNLHELYYTWYKATISKVNFVKQFMRRILWSIQFGEKKWIKEPYREYNHTHTHTNTPEGLLCFYVRCEPARWGWVGFYSNLIVFGKLFPKASFEIVLRKLLWKMLVWIQCIKSHLLFHIYISIYKIFILTKFPHIGKLCNVFKMLTLMFYMIYMNKRFMNLAVLLQILFPWINPIF